MEAKKKSWAMLTNLLVLGIVLVGCATIPSQEQMNSAEQDGVPILVNNLTCTAPNSAGGVSVHISAYNTSGKDIKYIRYNVGFTNKVDDLVRSEIGDKIVFFLRDTGPIQNNKKSSGDWENVIYNFSVESVFIHSATVDFVDGTSVEINASEVPFVVAKPNSLTQTRKDGALGGILGGLGGAALGVLLVLLIL